MSPQVTYWTGTWDPGKEAISKEISALRIGHRAKSVVIACSPANHVALSFRTRELTLPATWWPILRLAGPIVEPLGDVTHVFGGGSSWHLLRSVGRRPVLLTAVVPPSDAITPDLLARIAYVAAETEEGVAEWASAGVPTHRIGLIRPGIDLDAFRPTLPGATRFSLLFASTPSGVDEFEARGIPTLVELAHQRPDVDIIVPWRPWGDLDAARRALGALDPPDNFVVTYGPADMSLLYARVHACVVCFRKGAGKTCPNFVLEGLACGRPIVLTAGVGLAGLIARRQAGIVVESSASALADGIARVQADWRRLSENARRLAVEEFDLRHFQARYDELYRAIAA